MWNVAMNLMITNFAQIKLYLMNFMTSNHLKIKIFRAGLRNL